VDINAIHLSHILEASDLDNLNYFLSHTAFVISHKSERIETLLGVIWYLPVNSPILVVTNCPESSREDLTRELRVHLVHHKEIYLIHQKDDGIAQFFEQCGVYQILGTDGKVVDGKGEGMYIGALCAYQLGYPRWIIYYDADNFVPSALLEYTLAMSRLFMPAVLQEPYREYGTWVAHGRAEREPSPDLHNVRICWSSKPELGSENLDTKLSGRCTRVVSPLFSSLLKAWFGMRNYAISSSNAGEQGMSIKTAIALRFSSGFSIETFQLLDLLFNAFKRKGQPGSVVLQEYQARSPHFHEKKGDEHIKRMIAQSLGGFFLFERYLPRSVKRELKQVYHDLDLELMYPAVYPPLQDLPLARESDFVDQYKLSGDVDSQEMVFADEEAV
jgi:hypothetical protein